MCVFICNWIEKKREPRANKCDAALDAKNFKIRRIIEYPDTEKEGGGREGIGWKAGSFGLSVDFAKE